MRHMVDAIAAQGRNGDDALLHVSKQELRDLKTIGNAIGIKTTINPKTGIHEAFNWGKMLATGAGGAVGFVASGFNPLGAAAGAALASGAYTGAEGGSTQDMLMNAAISGATAYAGAGIASGLGEAGQAAAQGGTEAVSQGAIQGGTEATTGGLSSLAGQGAQQSAQVSNALLPQTVAAEGATIPGASTAPQAMTGTDILKGFDATSGKDLVSNYGMSAAKTGVGIAALGSLPTPNNDTTEAPSTGMNYKAETYVTPDGQRRTRAVPMAGGGLASMAQGAHVGDTGLASMAQGRYLQGPGDGMSDSIPASIDGKQEARLATGEFVVPADVVSHLGNGDSTAGAKQLHSMMDRARMTRTGTKQQGKQINPRKVMPA